MNFYEKTSPVKEKIKNKINLEFENVKDNRIKEILLQRQDSSAFIKGISSYFIHKGLNGLLSEEENVQLASHLEIYSTGLVILDNIIDNHIIRNGKTTFLEEYGIALNVIASHYATHVGLLHLTPYIKKFSEISGDESVISVGKAIEGMISMDIDKPKDSKSILESIARVNGLTLGIPLALSAVSSTTDLSIIYDTIQYGYDTGIAFGLYEELRDIFGEHGRKRLSEVKSGRTPFCLVECSERESNFCIDNYVGKDISEKNEEILIKKLINSGSVDYTLKLIKRHLGYGIDKLKNHLNQSEFEIMNSLRTTTENELERMLISN